jgi:hypothetical protein
MKSRNCLSFQSTWVHSRFLARFVLIDLYFSMWFCVDRCLSFLLRRLFFDLRLLVTPLVSSNFSCTYSIDHIVMYSALGWNLIHSKILCDYDCWLNYLHPVYHTLIGLGLLCLMCDNGTVLRWLIWMIGTYSLPGN